MTTTAILCVDDEKVILDSLKRQLRRRFGSDYIYEATESTEEARDVIEELSQDGIRVAVIICDWLMPGEKGDEFLIKIHEKYPDIVKILLTGHATEAAVKRVQQQANLHRYLPKPWLEDDLVLAIETGLHE